jgi:hypothetical protein
MGLLVDYSKNRAGDNVSPKRSSAPLFGLAPRRVAPRRRATHHDNRRRKSMTCIAEREEGHEEDEDPEVRIKFRMKRRGSTGAKICDTEEEPSAAKLHKSLTGLFFKDDADDKEEDGEQKGKADSDKVKKDDKGKQDDHSATSSTRSMDDFSSSLHTDVGNDQGDCFVDTRRFIRGVQQIIVSTIACDDTADHPVQKEERGFVDTSTFSRGSHQYQKVVSARNSTEVAPEDKLLARPPSSPASLRAMSQRQVNGDPMDATPDYTRRTVSRMPSRKTINKVPDASGGSSHSQNLLRVLARSSSLKNMRTDAADCRRHNFKRNSSMKTAKTEMAGLELERQDSLRMMKVHSLRNVMGDISDSWNDSTSINVPSGTSGRRTPTRSFSMMNFAGDINGALQLDRRAVLNKNKTVSSMRNLTRTLMDDTSSRDHYYRGCSMRNLMSDSTRTLVALLKDVSEKKQSEDAKRMHNDSVSRFNMMRQNSGRNCSGRNLKKECSERSLNVDRLNVMRQKSGRNQFSDRSKHLMKDLTEKTLGHDSSRRRCSRTLVRQESNNSMAQDQSMSTSYTRRQNRYLVNRGGSFRNLMDISESYSSTRRRAPKEGMQNETGNNSSGDKRGLGRCKSDLTLLKMPSSIEKSDPSDKDSSGREASRRLGLLLGQTISFRSNSKRNLCRASSGRSHSGSPVPKLIATSQRA